MNYSIYKQTFLESLAILVSSLSTCPLIAPLMPRNELDLWQHQVTMQAVCLPHHVIVTHWWVWDTAPDLLSHQPSSYILATRHSLHSAQHIRCNLLLTFSWRFYSKYFFKFVLKQHILQKKVDFNHFYRCGSFIAVHQNTLKPGWEIVAYWRIEHVIIVEGPHDS